MTKDEFIGVRVSKEVKDKLRKEAEKEGMSISRYFESCIKGNFQEPELIVESLIADAKEQNPDYWQLRKSGKEEPEASAISHECHNNDLTRGDNQEYCLHIEAVPHSSLSQNTSDLSYDRRESKQIQRLDF
jgi:hypothetical protein